MSGAIGFLTIVPLRTLYVQNTARSEYRVGLTHMGRQLIEYKSKYSPSKRF